MLSFEARVSALLFKRKGDEERSRRRKAERTRSPMTIFLILESEDTLYCELFRKESDITMT